MNIIILSPHFPPNMRHFCDRLKKSGANVLGIADAAYERLLPELRNNLTEYFRVDDMEDYDQILRACGFFTHKYGKIDRIESHNEYWLETEAQVRSDFNIAGINKNKIDKITRKSEMKKIFRKAGIDVAEGEMVSTLSRARAFVKKNGFPVIAKPDRGVGAANTYKLNSTAELVRFFERKPDVPYFMEAFIKGTIYSFDGLTDQHGNLVFYTSHVFSQGIMETVTEDRDIFYYALKEMPPDLERAGVEAVRAFNIQEKFFHLEFFYNTPDKKIYAIEVNVRPPGGLTLDMFNYAHSFDIYQEWVNILQTNTFTATPERTHYCGYIGRKHNKNYTYSDADIYARFDQQIVHQEELAPVLSKALGNIGYVAKAATLDELIDIEQFIHKTS
jgi:biotin carboxylase